MKRPGRSSLVATVAMPFWFVCAEPPANLTSRSFTGLPLKVARTVAEEIGARTAVLDPVESVHGGDDYLSVQRRNAAALHDALGCA